MAERLADVRARIEAAARRAGRDPRAVTLVGVTKRVPAERVAEAARAGLGCIGENYVQEAKEKFEALSGLPGTQGLVRHLIGPLQRNKAKEAVGIFDVIETVDRIALAQEIDRRAGAMGRTVTALLQVNVSGEPQKSGVSPEEVAGLLAACEALPSLRITGLMTVPAAAEDAEATRPAFAALRGLRDALRARPGGHGLVDLSMGMSADFEVAVEEGATLVRVGTAIFGRREG